MSSPPFPPISMLERDKPEHDCSRGSIISSTHPPSPRDLSNIAIGGKGGCNVLKGSIISSIYGPRGGRVCGHLTTAADFCNILAEAPVPTGPSVLAQCQLSRPQACQDVPRITWPQRTRRAPPRDAFWLGPQTFKDKFLELGGGST